MRCPSTSSYCVKKPPVSRSGPDVSRHARPATVPDHHPQAVEACVQREEQTSQLEDLSQALCSCGTSYEWERQELQRMYDQDQGVCSTSGADLRFLRFVADVGTRSNPPVGAVQLGSEPQAPKEKHNKDRHDDFYANVGDAIRTLREDVPELFREDLSYGIYRSDIVFRDPKNCFAGIDNYKLIFWSLRFHGRIFFKRLDVEVKRIWQKEDDSICLRWTVHGTSRLPWEPHGVFDGVSTYKLDSHGKIYEHKVDNVIFRDPPLARNPLLMRLNLSAVPQSQPGVPCPGSWGCTGGSVTPPVTFCSFYVAALATCQILTLAATPTRQSIKGSLASD